MRHALTAFGGRRGDSRQASGALRLAWALAAGLVITACGGNGDKTEAGTGDTAAAVAAVRPPAPGDPSCPRDGLWKPCALLDRITKAGLYFKATGDTLRVPFLTVPGVRYQVGTKAALVAFFYADSAALAHDFGSLDSVRVTVRGDTVGPWGGRPAAIRSANMLAVLIDGSSTQEERVGLAVTAGAPQAYSGK